MISRLLSHRLWWAWALFAVFLAFGGAGAQAITYNSIGDPFTSILDARGVAEPEFSLVALPLSQEVKRGKVASFSLYLAPEPFLDFGETVKFDSECMAELNAICGYTQFGDGTVIGWVDTSPGKKGTQKGSHSVTFTATFGGVTYRATVQIVVK